MKMRYLLLVGILVCLAGCTPVDSLNPLYAADSDIVYDEGLTGEWVPVDSSQSGGMEIGSIVDHGKNVGYTISSLDKDSSGNSKTEYEARLVKLGGREFLDVVPQQWEANSQSYSLQTKSTKTGVRVEPSVIRLGSAAYVRFTPGAHAGDLHADLVPAHWFVRVSMEGKTLRFDWMDDEKFRKAIQAGKVRIGSAMINDGKDVVITAPTAELQRFLTEHADDETLFTEHTDQLHRKEKE